LTGHAADSIERLLQRGRSLGDDLGGLFPQQQLRIRFHQSVGSQRERAHRDPARLRQRERPFGGIP